MFGRREDPAGALELADATQPLQPRGVEQVLLGDLFGRQPGHRGDIGREPLGQLEIAVDRVTDEVDRRERMAAGGYRYGTETCNVALHPPTLPALSRPRTLRL